MPLFVIVSPEVAFEIAYVTILSENHINTAPKTKPINTTIYDGIFSVFSARSIAGCNSDQNDAAIITPAEKPNIKFNKLCLGALKKTTIAAPSAVRPHVDIVAIRA